MKTQNSLLRHGLLAIGLGLFAAAPVAWSAEAQEIATTVCAACHGEGGNSVVPMFPKLAGQDAAYLEKQLREFFDNKRKNDVMAPILQNISKDDAKPLAVWYAAQKPAAGAIAEPGLVEAGKKLYDDGNTDSGVPACLGCHQENARGGGGGTLRYPRLAGQHQEYTILQLNNFKTGERANDKGKLMRVVAERMTEQEIKAVAEYLAGLQ
ncbi:MAG: cytochrome c4 [Desulfovibrionaceae bacterium]|nr:cytochrome c4 [Desulfovibrionaceae bacterium]